MHLLINSHCVSIHRHLLCYVSFEQETQLSLTNRATRLYRGQSRSPNWYHSIYVRYGFLL